MTMLRTGGAVLVAWILALAPACSKSHGEEASPEKPAGGALVIHGLADGTVAPSEGAASLAYWRTADKCAAGNGTSFAPSPCLALSCAAGHPVVHCEIPGLDHNVWSNAAQVTWKFFAEF